MKTPSKINLFLRVVGDAPNCHHEIETIFLPLSDIFDEIEISPAKTGEIKISSTSMEIPLNEDNLCHKAAKKYAETAGIEPAWNINIAKNIPIAAGMGGGSSDAAAVLLILQKAYGKLTCGQMLEIAAKLGADVPYFLNPIPSIGRGIGDILEPIAIKNTFTIVIANPLFPVSAAWAYKNLEQREPARPIGDILKSLASGDILNVASALHNDLAFALYKKFPALEILKNDLVECGALNAEITGSGPTIFGICRDIDNAKKVAEKITTKRGSAVICWFSEIKIRAAKN